MSPRVRILAALCLALGVASVAGALLEPEPPAQLELAIPPLAEISAIRLTRTGQPEVTLKRTGGGWRVLPDDAPIDATALDNLEAVLGDPVGMDKAEVDVADPQLGTYALTEHALTVDLEAPAGLRRFRVGKVVDGRRTFVRPLDDPQRRVLRAQANLRRAFDRPADDWRESRLFDAAFPDVRVLERHRRGERVWRAERSGVGEAWRVVHPAGVRAAQEILSGAANAFVTAEASAFPEEAFETSERFAVETFDGRRLHLDLSPPRPDGSRDAVRSGDGLRVRLPTRFAHFITLETSALRERRLLPADAAPLAEVRLPTGVHLVAGEEGWAMRAPRKALLTPEQVQEKVEPIHGIFAAGVPQQIPPDAFAAPEKIALALSDGRQVLLELGAAYQGEGARFARTSVDPEGVYVVSPIGARLLTQGVEDFVPAE